jgi:hypothetical protein
VRTRFAALIFAALASSTCSLFKTYAEIESSTSWSCACGNRTVDGTGNQKVDLGSDKCAVAQKQTRNGFLTLRVTNGESATTTADFGVVTSCRSGN